MVMKEMNWRGKERRKHSQGWGGGDRHTEKDRQTRKWGREVGGGREPLC